MACFFLTGTTFCRQVLQMRRNSFPLFSFSSVASSSCAATSSAEAVASSVAGAVSTPHTPFPKPAASCSIKERNRDDQPLKYAPGFRRTRLMYETLPDTPHDEWFLKYTEITERLPVQGDTAAQGTCYCTPKQAAHSSVFGINSFMFNTVMLKRESQICSWEACCVNR